LIRAWSIDPENEFRMTRWIVGTLSGVCAM
jgi:hypothetical protein